MWNAIITLDPPDKVIIGLLVLVAAWGVFRWIWDLRSKRQLTKEIESLRAKYGRRHIVHQLQFTEEFAVYKELWKALLKLVDLAPIMPSVEMGPVDRDSREKRLHEAFKACVEASSVIELNRPFFHREIYELSHNLNMDCLKHIRRVQRRLEIRQENECYDLADKLLADTRKIIDQIEQAIRKRIGILTEAELID